MSKWFNRKRDSDPLTKRLRAGAQAFDPDLPSGLHRRVLSALAEFEGPERGKSQSRLAWLFAAGTVAAAAIVAVMVLRDHAGLPAPVPKHSPGMIVLEPKTYPNPLTLAMQYVDDPLETEARNLLKDLSSASTTVTHVFPGGGRRAQKQPTTKGPAGAGV